jgi:hypothetical protein
MLDSDVTLDPNDVFVSTTPDLMIRSNLATVTFPAESFKSRPKFMFFLQSFTVSHAKSSLLFDIWGAEESNKFGYTIRYSTVYSPLKGFSYHISTLCPNINDCLNPSSISTSELDFEEIAMYFNGLPTIGTTLINTQRTLTINFAFKATLYKTPKYFMAAAHQKDVLLPSGTFGSVLTNYTLRSFTLTLYVGANSAMGLTGNYYLYSNWGIFFL